MIEKYFEFYQEKIAEALNSVCRESLKKVYDELIDAFSNGIPLLVCGNGGSAAISEHFSCDHTKCIQVDTELKSFVIPLASNVSMITAIANDISYDEIFSKQIEWFDFHAIVLVISSSGNSPNILKALEVAKKKNMKTIAFVGFDGGKVVENKLADIILHIDSKNYGIVEDCHQSLMHILAQYLRLSFTKNDVSKIKL